MSVRIKQNLQQEVREILLNDPKCRDCDVYLTWRVWDNHIVKGLGEQLPYTLKDVNAVELFTMWKEKKLPDPSAIRRARRKIQETDSKTRGKVYYERHKNQENIKEDLGYAKGVRIQPKQSTLLSGLNENK